MNMSELSGEIVESGDSLKERELSYARGDVFVNSSSCGVIASVEFKVGLPPPFIGESVFSTITVWKMLVGVVCDAE